MYQQEGVEVPNGSRNERGKRIWVLKQSITIFCNLFCCQLVHYTLKYTNLRKKKKNGRKHGKHSTRSVRLLTGKALWPHACKTPKDKAKSEIIVTPHTWQQHPPVITTPSTGCQENEQRRPSRPGVRLSPLDAACCIVSDKFIFSWLYSFTFIFCRHYWVTSGSNDWM